MVVRALRVAGDDKCPHMQTAMCKATTKEAIPRETLRTGKLKIIQQKGRKKETKEEKRKRHT